MQAALWLFHKAICFFKRRPLGTGSNNSRAYKHGENLIQIILKLVFLRDLRADFINAERIVDIHQEEIAGITGTANVLVNQHALVDKKENRDRGIRKPRASVRKKLSETKQAASPKKAAARSKQHEMEV